MIKESFYNLEKAQLEAEKMKGLVGEKGEGEDYSAAEKLLEETGEVLTKKDAKNDGVNSSKEKTGCEEGENRALENGIKGDGKQKKERGPAVKELINSYYQKRNEIAKSTNIIKEEKLELIRNLDRKRVAAIVESEDIYQEYFKRNHSSNVERMFIKSAENALLRTISKEHLVFGPNVTFIASKENPVSGLSFQVKVSDIFYDNPEKTTVRIDMDITEAGEPNIEHRCSMLIDKGLGTIRTAVLPEGLQIQDPRIYVGKSFRVPRIELEALLAVANLSKSINYESVPYGGKRITPSDQISQEHDPTKIEEKKLSLLSFRRRTIGNIEAVPDAIDELLASLDDYYNQILKDAGKGKILLRLYSKQRDNYRLIDRNIPSEDTERIYRAALVALEDGDTLITFEHAWRPPELDNAPGGSPKAPHTRRLAGKVVLVVGNAIESRKRERILSLWEKRAGGKLTEEELSELTSFLNRNGLHNEDIKAELKLAEGIHFKDGRFVKGAGSGTEHIYST